MTQEALTAKADDAGWGNRRYTPDVKAEAVKRVLDAGQRVSDVARELGVKPGSLYLWLRKAEVLARR